LPDTSIVHEKDSAPKFLRGGAIVPKLHVLFLTIRPDTPLNFTKGGRIGKVPHKLRKIIS
jgi:hypothetical protein